MLCAHCRGLPQQQQPPQVVFSHPSRGWKESGEREEAQWQDECVTQRFRPEQAAVKHGTIAAFSLSQSQRFLQQKCSSSDEELVLLAMVTPYRHLSVHP